MSRFWWIALCTGMGFMLLPMSSLAQGPPSYISLGALSGTDADLLAQTLSSVFHGEFVVTTCTDKSSDTGSSPPPSSAGNIGGESSGTSKHTLKIEEWRQANATSPTPSSSSPQCGSSIGPRVTTCSASPPDECDLLALAHYLDRDSFKGGVLSSAYVIRAKDIQLPGCLSEHFAHPLPDLDVELVRKSDNTPRPYLVLVPTPLVQGNTAAVKTLAKDAAGLKQDFVRLVEYGQSGKPIPSCQNNIHPDMAERCRADNTIALQVLDPREVAMYAHDLYPGNFDTEIFPLNRAISFVPNDQGSSADPIVLQVRAVEQFELYKQNQAQQQLLAALQTAAAAPSAPQPPPTTTTTTTTIKTPVPSNTKKSGASNAPPAGTGGNSTTNRPPAPSNTNNSGTSNAPPAGTGGNPSQTQSSTVTISTSTSTSSTTGSGSSPTQSSAQGGSSTQGGSSSGGTSGGSGNTQAANTPAQPAAPSWSVDNIVRLYDYRDAAGIATAINGMVSYAPNSRPIVQPLSDFGANDMIEILPSAAAQGGYNIGDIERAISLLDLPRPQLSLQVWSYQITAKVKNPGEAYKNPRRKCTNPCKGGSEDDDTRVALEMIDRRVDMANRRMIRALESGMEAIFLAATKSEKLCKFDLSHCPVGSNGTPVCAAQTSKRTGDIESCQTGTQPAASDDCKNRAVEEFQKCVATSTTEKKSTDEKSTEVKSTDWNKLFGNETDGFFDNDFRKYLTMRYDECIQYDQYCLGYFNALDFPEKKSDEDKKENRFVANASLGRMLLFLVAANDDVAKCLVTLRDDNSRCQSLRQSVITENVIGKMRIALGKDPQDDCADSCSPPCNRKKPCPEPSFPKECKTDCCCYFSRFAGELDRITEPGNLRILRQAFLDFFFNFKWTLNYPNDFVPYDIRRSAHTLDDLLQPVVNAFNQDVDEYVQDAMDDPSLIPRDSKAGLISRGMVQVAALSGTPATVSGEVMNYFNITQPTPISSVINSSPSSIPGWASTNPYSVGGAALANLLSAQKVEAQLTRGITLSVTPTSLDTADSAELNVSLTVNEPDGAPQSVNTATVSQDLLNRVAQHLVTDTVRVQNLKLFDLSTFSMEITHPKTPACLPLDNDDGTVKTVFYYATFPVAVPCVVWRSVFASVPVAGRLFEWPRQPETVDNRSVAIIRAVVVPTAMDIGESLDFESDRVLDPVTHITESLSSVGQLGWKVRQFHRLMMECVLNDKARGCPAQLHQIPDDTRKPTTN
jgi:hypothetical protein